MEAFNIWLKVFDFVRFRRFKRKCSYKANDYIGNTKSRSEVRNIFNAGDSRTSQWRENGSPNKDYCPEPSLSEPGWTLSVVNFNSLSRYILIKYNTGD